MDSEHHACTGPVSIGGLSRAVYSRTWAPRIGIQRYGYIILYAPALAGGEERRNCLPISRTSERGHYGRIEAEGKSRWTVNITPEPAPPAQEASRDLYLTGRGPHDSESSDTGISSSSIRLAGRSGGIVSLSPELQNAGTTGESKLKESRVGQ